MTSRHSGHSANIAGRPSDRSYSIRTRLSGIGDPQAGHWPSDCRERSVSERMEGGRREQGRVTVGVGQFPHMGHWQPVG